MHRKRYNYDKEVFVKSESDEAEIRSILQRNNIEKADKFTAVKYTHTSQSGFLHARDKNRSLSHGT